MKRTCLALLFLTSVAALNAATISYHISIDSSGIPGSTPGLIEFQFNQTNSNTSLAGLATLTNFTSSGFTFDDFSNYSQGGITGSITGLPLVFDNTGGASNIFDQGVTQFGSGFSFDISLSGDAVTLAAPDGSEFFVLLLRNDLSPLVLSDGLVATLTINPNASVTPGTSALSTISVPVATPEPTTLLTGLAGLALVLAGRKLKNR